MLYTYKATLNKVVDGDTVDLNVDLGFRIGINIRARLLHVDTPEIYHPKSPEERSRGLQAKEFTKEFIETSINQNGYVIIKSSKDDDPLGTGKYGRWLVEVKNPSSGLYLHEQLEINNLVR